MADKHHITIPGSPGVGQAILNNPNNVEVITTLRYDPALIRSSQNTQASWDIPSFFYMLEYHRRRMLEAVEFYDVHMNAQMGYCSPNLNYLMDPEAFRILVNRFTTNHAQYLIEQGCNEEDIFKYSFNCRSDELPLPAKPHKVRILQRPFCLPELTFSEIPPVAIEGLFPPKLSITGEKAGFKVQKWSLHLDTAPTSSNATTTFKLVQRDLYNTAYKRVITDEVKAAAGLAIPEVILYDENGLVTEGSFTSLYFVRDGYWVTPRVTELSREKDEQKWRGGQRGTTRRWALENELCIEGDVTVDSIEDGERVWVSNGVRGFGYGEIRRTPKNTS